jgi:Na+/H+-translocating membrane pyrophosphatase
MSRATFKSFVLLNVLESRSGYVGQVISTHSTLALAGDASRTMSRKIRRANGGGAYLPMTIRHVDTVVRRSEWLTREQVSVICLICSSLQHQCTCERR